VRAFLSRDLELSTGDPELSGVTNRTTPIEPGESYIETRTLFTSSYPETGDWNLIIKVDAPALGNPALPGSVSETNETNNTSLGMPVQLKADLAVSDVEVGEVSATGDGRYSFPATFTVSNLGNSRINVDWYKPMRVRAFLSRDLELSTGDPELSGVTNRTTPIEPGESYIETRTLFTSSYPETGDWNLIIKVDAPAFGNPALQGSVSETNETNNTSLGNVQLQADLTISDLLVGTVSDAGGGRYSFPVTYTVRNIGSSRITVDYYKPIRMSAYLSRDADISSSDLALSGLLSRSSPMAPGESFTETRTVTSMANPGSGQWTVLIKVDAPLGANPAVNGTIAESNEQNNVVSAGVQLP
jgi:subtilase family serine protease